MKNEEKEKTVADSVLSFVKATKGTYVFGNEQDGFRSIYVDKSKLETKRPEDVKLRLRLTIEEG